jgi:hypothetical protein
VPTTGKRSWSSECQPPLYLKHTIDLPINAKITDIKKVRSIPCRSPKYPLYKSPSYISTVYGCSL